MKSLFFTAGMILLLLSGCGSDNDTIVAEDTQDPVAVTENLIALDPSLKTSAENIVVFNLEHHGAAANAEDTATAGTDCYTYLHDEAMQTTLSVDTDNSIGSLFVTNKTTNETTTVLSGEISVPFEFSANTDYEVCVTHNGASDQMQTVFVRFNDTASASVASSAIASTDIQPVGYNPDDLKKLLATNECQGCDLSEANLRYSDLSEANLRHSDLSEAKLDGANLSYADLTQANLSNADLNHADLNHVTLFQAGLSQTSLIQSDLTQADLRLADLSQANLTQANLTQADLSQANLIQANLTKANLDRADLYAADLSRATWIDGTICKEGSYGECKK